MNYKKVVRKWQLRAQKELLAEQQKFQKELADKMETRRQQYQEYRDFLQRGLNRKRNQ